MSKEIEIEDRSNEPAPSLVPALLECQNGTTYEMDIDPSAESLKLKREDGQGEEMFFNRRGILRGRLYFQQTDPPRPEPEGEDGEGEE